MLKSRRALVFAAVALATGVYFFGVGPGVGWERVAVALLSGEFNRECLELVSLLFCTLVFFGGSCILIDQRLGVGRLAGGAFMVAGGMLSGEILWFNEVSMVRQLTFGGMSVMIVLGAMLGDWMLRKRARLQEAIRQSEEPVHPREREG